MRSGHTMLDPCSTGQSENLGGSQSPSPLHSPRHLTLLIAGGKIVNSKFTMRVDDQGFRVRAELRCSRYSRTARIKAIGARCARSTTTRNCERERDHVGS